MTLIAAIFMVACNDEIKTPQVTDAVAITQANTEEINEFISENNLEVQSTPSGLFYVIQEEGDGSNPSATSTVRVAYKGYFTNGNTFDESDANGISFPLNRVIRGWTEGIPLFKEGGKGMLIIPSRLAYGTRGTRGIPPNAVLVFDINLLEVVSQ